MARPRDKHKEYLKTVGDYYHLILFQYIQEKMDKEELERTKRDNRPIQIFKDNEVVYEIKYNTLFNKANKERLLYNRSRLS